MLHNLMLTSASMAGLVVTPTLVGGLDLGALAGADPDAARAAPEVPLLAQHDLCVLCFSSGSSIVAESAVQTLQRAWDWVKADATLQEVLVIGYGDQDYPRDPSIILPRSERQLAEDRCQAVRDHLLELGAPQVSVVSMAKRASWLQTLFTTAEAQLKRYLDGLTPDMAGVEPFYREVGQVLEGDGGPGKVIIAMRKELLFAH